MNEIYECSSQKLEEALMFERRENEHNWWRQSILITQRWRLEEETEISIWINRHPQDGRIQEIYLRIIYWLVDDGE